MFIISNLEFLQIRHLCISSQPNFMTIPGLGFVHTFKRVQASIHIALNSKKILPLSITNEIKGRREYFQVQISTFKHFVCPQILPSIQRYSSSVVNSNTQPSGVREDKVNVYNDQIIFALSRKCDMSSCSVFQPDRLSQAE